MYSLYKSLFRLPIDNEIENWSPAQVLQDKPVESSTKTTNMQCGSCGEAIDVMDPSSLDHICATQGASGKMKCEHFFPNLPVHPGATLSGVSYC